MATRQQSTVASAGHLSDRFGSLAPRNLDPGLAVGLVPAELPRRQPSALTLRLDPPQTVMNATGDIRLVTRPVPPVALIVPVPPARRQVGGEEYAALVRVA